MDPVERIREHLTFEIEFNLNRDGRHRMDAWAKQRHEAIATYRSLTYEQVLAAGHILLATYDTCLRRERDEHLTTFLTTVPIEDLHYLAVFQPAAMRELYPEVIERDQLLWHGEIFCAGDATTRDSLLARLPVTEIASGTIEEFTEAAHLVTCLAWIPDDTVVAKFAEWRDVKLVWRPNAAQLARDPSIAGQSSTTPLANATYAAGWELTAEGARRNLYVDHWRKLLPATDGGDHPAPVSVGGLMDAQCQWCGRELTAILDLDLRSPEVAFLGLSGDRLRIPVCRWCSYVVALSPLFWHVDMSGGASWHEANGERPEQNAQLDTWLEDEPEWSLAHYTPGPERTNPYASVVPENDYDPNRLGGLPEWVQYPEYPNCPDCGRSLRFLGQLDADEHGGWEGLIYAFHCAECGVAATVQQQT